MAAETAVGVFATRAQAQAALATLQARGFAADTISVLAREDEDPDAADADKVAAGAAMGGVLGALGGWLLGAGLILVPGIGPLLAVGPLLTALGGAAVGAGTGGLVAALVDAGMDEAQAQRIEEQVRGGAVLVTIAPTEHHEEARGLLREAGATETDFSLTGDEI